MRDIYYNRKEACKPKFKPTNDNTTITK